MSTATVPSGLVVLAPQPDGTTLVLRARRRPARSGHRRADSTLLVDPRWNRRDHAVSPPADRIVPYLWDDAQACLTAAAPRSCGSAGTGSPSRSAIPRPGTTGLAVLIDTDAATPVDPPIREVVHLTGAFEETDPLYGVPVTRLTWDAAEALTQDHDLGRTRLAGNLVGASEGRRYTETFVIDPDPAAPDAALAAVARTGPDAGCADAAPIYLHTLTADGSPGWPPASGDASAPQVQLALPADHR